MEAARLLEAELEEFAKHTRAIEKEPLSSRKSLDRAGASLGKIADSEDRLPAAMGALTTALGKLRQRHEEQTEIVRRRAEEIRQRTEVYRLLLERMGALVARAAEMNGHLTSISTEDKEKDQLVAELDGVLQEIGALTDATGALKAEAKQQTFEDVAREADGLADQLGAAKSKLARLKKDLARG
jgi:SMC interacting uncharacterized protein involved in chromosome segregation